MKVYDKKIDTILRNSWSVNVLLNNYIPYKLPLMLLNNKA